MTNKEISTKCLALWKLYKAKEITLAQLTIECKNMMLSEDLPMPEHIKALFTKEYLK